MTSSLWRLQVMWRHRQRDLSTPIGNFPITYYIVSLHETPPVVSLSFQDFILKDVYMRSLIQTSTSTDNKECLKLVTRISNKTAGLSHRRPHDAPNIWVLWKVLITTHPDTFPEICNGLLFRTILRMCVQNLKFVALPVPEIIGVLKKFGQSLASFSPKILKGFCSDGPCEYTCQSWSS